MKCCEPPVLPLEPSHSETLDSGHLTALGQALSDPIRVRILSLMAQGRNCCDLPDMGVPDQDDDLGICVCEFASYFGVGQSRISYHVAKLKDAGLIRERSVGKWNFYAIDTEAARKVVTDLFSLLRL